MPGTRPVLRRQGRRGSAVGGLGVSTAIRMERAGHPALHPGQCLRLLEAAGEELGHVGMLSPAVARELDFGQPLFLFELFMDRLPVAATPRFRMPSKFPAVRRDIAVVVARQAAAADLLAVIRHAAGHLLTEARIFDVYQGEGLENNEKALP